jgi:hypothetical protein
MPRHHIQKKTYTWKACLCVRPCVYICAVVHDVFVRAYKKDFVDYLKNNTRPQLHRPYQFIYPVDSRKEMLAMPTRFVFKHCRVGWHNINKTPALEKSPSLILRSNVCLFEMQDFSHLLWPAVKPMLKIVLTAGICPPSLILQPSFAFLFNQHVF